MHLQKYGMRLFTVIALIILMAVGVHTAFDGNRSAYAPIKYSLFTILIYLSPLMLVLVSVVKAHRNAVALSAAWVAIFVGGYIEYGYYASHDPSKVMLLAVNLVAYWGCGFVAIFSFL